MAVRLPFQQQARATVDGRDVIVIYGNTGELHEIAFTFSTTPPDVKVVFGLRMVQHRPLSNDSVILQFTTSDQTVNMLGNVMLYILGR